MNTLSDGKSGFRGVPFVGTCLNMVGEPREFQSQAMRAKMAAELPKAILESFATKLKTPFTSENLRSLLADPTKALDKD